MRGKTGAPGRSEHLLPQLSGALLKIANESQVKRTGKTQSRGRPIQIPDETVLEIRRRHELEGWSFMRLVRAYPDIKPRNIRRLMDYETRGNLRIN